MKTLSDFKREAVVGSKWHTTYRRGDYFEDRGIREIDQVQTKKIRLKRDDGKISYFDFPTSKEVRFVSNNTMEYFDDALDIVIVFTLITE